MSALTIWQGLFERFQTIEGLKAIILGEPTTIQETPLLYAAYASASQIMRSQAPARNLDGIVHEFAVRLVFDYQSNPDAEMQLLTLADSVPYAINLDARLGGRLTGGVASCSSAISGFVLIASKLYRILEPSFAQVIKRAKAHKISHRTAAMAIGVERVLKAKKMRGLFP